MVAGSNLAAVVPMLYSLYSLSPHVPNAESPPQKHNTISPLGSTKSAVPPREAAGSLFFLSSTPRRSEKVRPSRSHRSRRCVSDGHDNRSRRT